MDSAGFFCNGFRQTVRKLLIIYFSHLHGVQVVAGSNPVAPTTVFLGIPSTCFCGAWAVFLFEHHQCGHFLSIWSAYLVRGLKQVLEFRLRIVRRDFPRFVTEKILPVLERHFRGSEPSSGGVLQVVNADQRQTRPSPSFLQARPFIFRIALPLYVKTYSG
jgi:hypothetical protein